MQVRIRAAALVVGFGVVGLLTGGGVAPGAGAPASGHCHVVDGSFTSCPDGSAEWSDVPAHFFPATGAYLYADQADLDPVLKGPRSDADTFELMYDECARTTPLGANEYFLVTFDTVEEEDGAQHLERYAIHVFANGTIIFFENGEAVPDDSGKLRVAEIEGQRGDAAFGPSPHCAAPHLTVEFEIKLTATGLSLNGGYSPDPIFWGATPPKENPTANDDEGDLEDNESVTVPVTANDTDPDDGIDPASVVIVSQPKNGTAVSNGDGSVTFTKNMDFKRTDSFTYTVNDTEGHTSNVANVDILRPCSTEVGRSLDDKSSPAAAGKKTKKGTDVDKDGIVHEDETKIGTDPCHFDTDDDGLADPWEASGVGGAGFDLNGDGSVDVSREQVFAGATPNPLHKDVFVELDAFDCNKGGCPPGDPMVHDFSPAAIGQLRAMFASLPAQNPDKAPGVNLHLQVDELVPHTPNCLLPPLGARPNFGTADQRGNGSVIAAKAMAYRYIVSGHSTLRGAGCPTPSLLDIGRNMFDSNFPLPDYDNTPFGRATVGGADMVLSLSPVWICPRNKVVAAPILLPLFPLPPIFFVAVVTVCDRESIFDPGIFPTTVVTSSGNKKLNQPYARTLGGAGGETAGGVQLQARSVAHLLGHSLGLAGEGEVQNDPAKAPGLGVDPYTNIGGIQYAKSLVNVSDGGDHLTFERTGSGSATAPEVDIFGNPIEELLETDVDGDGTIERLDNCPGEPNPSQADLEGDGSGDTCDADIDNDAIANAADSFPNDTDNDGSANGSDADDDADAVADTAENCALVPNADQRDTDGDGFGDACDTDSDADGVPDAIERRGESNPLDAASTPEWAGFAGSCGDGIDNDGDSAIDAGDLGCRDFDGDTIPNYLDRCQFAADFGADLDADGLVDACEDNDDDNDGASDSNEIAFGSDPNHEHSTPEAPAVGNTCNDGVDNDEDGLTDGDDLRCRIDVPGIIASPLVQLGVNQEGHLNVFGGTPSSGTRTTIVGLRFRPTNAESTAPGCLCEGWGVADATTGVAGYANESIDGVVNLQLESFRRTAETAVSVVRVGNPGTFRVTHDYHPSPFTDNLYEVKVTIENTSGQETDVRYRRVMDWDVEPTAFNEFVTVVTLQGSELAKNVLFSSNGGFATANPLGAREWSSETECLGDDPTTPDPPEVDHACIGDFQDAGPDDHGALFDFGFGKLQPGEKVTFFTYYGAAATEVGANAALAAVQAEVYSFGQPNTPDGPTLGTPNTFVFAFSGVGGEPVLPPDSDRDTVLDELDNCPVTKNQDQQDTNLDGIGDACTTANLEHSTAGFLQADLDGGTIAEPTSVLVSEEPTLVERVVRIVRFRIAEGLATDALALTEELVDSLVESGLVEPGDADDFVDDVIAQLDTTPPVVKVTFPLPDGTNGWFVHSPVLGTVTANDASHVTAIVCTGATVGVVSGLGTTTASAPLTVSGDGRHDVSCSATDGVGNAGTGPGSSATAVVKIDTTAPVVTCSASPNSLWPPDHELVAVTTSVSVTDGLSGPAGFVLTAAASSEPDDENGNGDGVTTQDLQGWTAGTADTQGLLRAERSASGPGRTYTLTYEGSDDAGNKATCAATVRIPRDQGGP